MNAAVVEVLGRYAISVRSMQALGNHGGFSGAMLWRIESDRGPLCLRAWPPAQMTELRLITIHRWMRHAALPFVPIIHSLPNRETWCVHFDRMWEVTSWMPGKADFHEHPSTERIESASKALAALHVGWRTIDAQVGPCPAVERRLEHIRAWRARANAGWEVPAETGPVQPWAERAWRLVRPRLQALECQLSPWMECRLPLQPCLCDIWHDHVLFTDEQVSGIIDYGAMKVDQVAVDLARMLGSLAKDDVMLRQAGLRAYARVRPLSLEEEALVPILDESTTVLGAANWLKWIFVDRKPFEDIKVVARRLGQLVQRIERWN
jgi:homoserine kinase type II